MHAVQVLQLLLVGDTGWSVFTLYCLQSEPTEKFHFNMQPGLRNKRGRDSERPVHHDEKWPPLATTRKALAQKRRPNTAKNK